MSLRINTAAIAAALVTALLAGPATAEVWPAGRDGARLSTPAAYPDLVERAVAGHKAALSTPAAYPDLVDRAVASHKAGLLAPDDRVRVRPESSVQPSQPRVSRSGDGFDWGAAGIGASTTTALLLALGFGVVVTRRTRIRSAAA